MQFVVLIMNNNKNDYEFGVTIAAIPITILILFMAAYWTRKENRVGMVVIIVCGPVPDDDSSSSRSVTHIY